MKKSKANFLAKKAAIPAYMKRVAHNANVDTSLHQRTNEFGVVYTHDCLVVRIFDQKVKGGVHEIDLSIWLKRPGIAAALADYISVWGRTSVAATRNRVLFNFSAFYKFLDYLDDKKGIVITEIEQITSFVFGEYETWLNQQYTSERSSNPGRPWSATSKATRYNLIASFIESCRSLKDHRDRLTQDLNYKKNPWPGRHHSIVSRAALSRVDIIEVRRACIKSIENTIRRLELGHRIINDDSIILPIEGDKSVIPYKDIRVRLRVLLKRYGAKIENLEHINNVDPGFARSLREPYGSLEDAMEHLHFTVASLVPFVVLLALEGAFNPEGLLSLKWDGIEEQHPVFGTLRWRVSVQKARAGRPHSRSFAASAGDPTSAVNLLRSIKTYSSITRKICKEDDKNKVFIFYINRRSSIRSFDNINGASSDALILRALAKFVSKNKLPKFTLSTLRATASDITDQISGGDIRAKQVALGHATTVTTDRHYQSTAAKQRGREALAAALSWRERFIATVGRSDPRGNGLVEGRNTAATPGFGCFEPSLSPIAGQREGRVCSAFGECPACPLAWCNTTDPKAYLRLRQLRDRLADAFHHVHPMRWRSGLQPQLDALDQLWLPRFSAAVIRKAKSITLPPLPEIE